jgi:hypothetical protein
MLTRMERSPQRRPQDSEAWRWVAYAVVAILVAIVVAVVWFASLIPST